MLKFALSDIRKYLENLQTLLKQKLLESDPELKVVEDTWLRPGGGGGRTLSFSGAGLFEKAGVNFSAVSGNQLPLASTAERPELAGAPFSACGVSVIIHPGHPHVPLTHMNVRYFEVSPEGKPAVWWFGGGFDLTPCFAYEEDVVSWHRAAKAACEVVGGSRYADFKRRCDQYFYLPHRKELRGVGGLFFDDYTDSNLENAFALMRSVGDCFWPAYEEIVERRKCLSFTEEERTFQLVRRGRYAEFNLLYDRGTRFGLESGGRTESILISLPPLARWDYDESWQPKLRQFADDLKPFLKARDWLGDAKESRAPNPS